MPETWLRRRLQQCGGVPLNLYAVSLAFLAYACMFAFRKPFAAAAFRDAAGWNSQVQLKTAFVIAQIVGYAVSKFVGIRVCSESARRWRAVQLILLIAAAEGALVLFAMLPLSLKPLAMFANGLPLGIIWGLMVRYLEGRRASDFLLAGLSCSFIVSSGFVKDVGRAFLAGDAPFGISWLQPASPISEFWMPAATGALFFLPFVLAVLLLDQLPEPTEADAAMRTKRQPMDRAERVKFLKAFFPGLVALMLFYLFLTAFRDYRDNYMADVFDELGYRYADSQGLFTATETAAALGVMLLMATLVFLPNNRAGLAAAFAMMASGALMLAASTLAYHAQLISGFAWMTLLGLGAYLAYVPYNSVLFDRLIASTAHAGTAVFAIYLADTIGYSGSVAVQLVKDFWGWHVGRADFLGDLANVTSIVGVIMVVFGGGYFLRRSRDVGGPMAVDELNTQQFQSSVRESTP
jgi:hypothetical protein